MTDPRYMSPSARLLTIDGSMYDHATFMDERVAQLEAQNENWKDHYNDLIGRIPNWLLTDINNGTRRHVCEYRSAYEEQYGERDARQRDLIRRLANMLELTLTGREIWPDEEVLLAEARGIEAPNE